MKNRTRFHLIFLAFIILLGGAICTNAQSGTANLNVFIHAGKVGGKSEKLTNVKVLLRPIENLSGTKTSVEAELQENGNYFATVSFGEYELIVTAKGYQTYRAVIYLPSSVTFTNGVRLHPLKKSRARSKIKK